MINDMMIDNLANVRRMLANPAVKGELRTRLERLLKLGAERETLRGAMEKQDGEGGRPEAERGAKSGT